MALQCGVRITNWRRDTNDCMPLSSEFVSLRSIKRKPPDALDACTTVWPRSIAFLGSVMSSEFEQVQSKLENLQAFAFYKKDMPKFRDRSEYAYVHGLGHQ